MPSEAPVFPLNPFVSPQLDDPYPGLAEARSERPIFFNPVLEMYVLTRYADALTVVKSPEKALSRDTVRLPSDLAPEAKELLDGGYSETSILVNDDPPQHTRLRRLVSRAFSQPRIAQLEESVRSRTQALVDGAFRGGPVDIVSSLSYPLPLQVICSMLGVPEDKVDEIKTWSDDWVLLTLGQLSPEEQVRCARSLLAFQQFSGSLVERRRAEPADDMVTHLIDSQVDGESMTTPEIAVFLMGLLIAAHETTTNLISNSVLWLLRTDQWRLLVEDASLVPGAIEEVLRYDPPVQGMIRTAAETLEIGGIEIPAGAQLWVSFASANRDSAEFDDPDRLDIQRASSSGRHLGFSKGIHFCLGAQLARLEARVALETLTKGHPDLRLAEGQELQYVPNLVHRGPQRLVVESAG